MIPGVTGRGARGPALDGVGSRRLIAGTLTNTPQNMARWIMHTQQVKPGTAMPQLGVASGRRGRCGHSPPCAEAQRTSQDSHPRNLRQHQPSLPSKSRWWTPRATQVCEAGKRRLWVGWDGVAQGAVD